MSIPWILIDHILTSQNPALVESVLYQLDLYNGKFLFTVEVNQELKKNVYLKFFNYFTFFQELKLLL